MIILMFSGVFFVKEFSSLFCFAHAAVHPSSREKEDCAAKDIVRLVLLCSKARFGPYKVLLGEQQ